MIAFAAGHPLGDDTSCDTSRRLREEYHLSARNAPTTTAANLRRAHALRTTLLESITDSTIKEAVGALTSLAVGGNLAAIKLLFEYAAGRPAQAREIAVPDSQPGGLSTEQIQAAVLGALSPHPLAKTDLAAALDAMARDRSIRAAGESLRRQSADD